MTLDYDSLDAMRANHPAWRLLKAEQAPLVASFLHRVFIAPNVRIIAQSELAEALEDELYHLRERFGLKAYPKSAVEYLNDWAANDKGWLRKFYREGSDEPQFDLTAATEKAIAWLVSLTERSFVGTESRLLTLFELLKQITRGSETDPAVRIEELQKRRDEVDTEIARISMGDISILDDTAIKERFQQFVSVARELLADFREVEHNFRMLDRSVREQIATWEGGKGELLGEIMGKRDAIVDTDQGRSFRAFWDFLMSSRRQEELTQLLDSVLALPAISSLNPDGRLRRIHYDWLEAGEHTQRTVAQLSQQLRRFLDDAAWLENRRIMDILHGIESKALALRSASPQDDIMWIDLASMEIELPLERSLYKPPLKHKITSFAVAGDDSDIDHSALFSQMNVDKSALMRHIRQSLQQRTQVTLTELLEKRPLEHGLAELVAYFQLATETFEAVVDESTIDTVQWNADDGNCASGEPAASCLCEVDGMVESPVSDISHDAACQQPAVAVAAGNELSAVVITLLKGVLYQDEDSRLWQHLLNLQARVREYVAVLGLELILHEAEGYAFLRSRQSEEPGEAASTIQTQVPRLVVRRQLSLPVSLLLALLRKKLAEFDARGGDTRLVLSRDDIVELIRVFLPHGTNETRLVNQIDTHINKIVELGFLRRLGTRTGKDDYFEVRRIIKAFVDAQWLSEFDMRLEQYRNRLTGQSGEAGDE